MRLSRSKKGYITSIIFILVIVFPYNLPQLNKTHEEEIVLTSNTPNSGINIINHNFLFTYNPTEKIKLTEVFNRFNAIKINYYRNFPIGFITLNSQNYLKMKNSYPDIFSRLHVSKSNLALPSIEELCVASKLSQFDYVPPSSIINATILWDKGIDGSGIKIGIIDSGIDSSRPDFEGRVDFSESFVTSIYGFDSEEGPEDLHGHGTHVAGIAAGSGDLIKGIAPKARIYNLKAVSMGGHSTKESVIAAIDKAISLNLDILSISLGFGTSLPWDSEDEMSLAINTAVNNGITVVVAAGNEGEDNPLSTIGTPASASKAITVGATNGSRHVVAFSSRGPSIDFRFDPDVVAPGYQIFGPLASGGVLDLAYNAIEGITLGDYVSLSGTSMATPVVSGAIALLKQQFQDANPYVLRAALQETAIDLESKESIYSQGSGIIDVASASDLLTTTHKSSGFQLISSLPRANNARPVEFSERITYPGDSTQATFSVVTGTEGTIDWIVSDSIKKFINIDNLTDNFSESTLIEKFIEVDIPLNTIPGRYKGNISYNFNDKLYSIPVDINVKVPHAKIYWDTWRTGRDDSTFFNYRALDEILDSKLSFDINSYAKTITWENISQNDILVLTDLENPLSYIEIEQIKRFHDHNGSILLVASAQPYFNPQAYSQIIEKLNLPINFSRTIDLISYLDDGRNRNIVPLTANELQLNWDSNNELFVGVEQVPPFIGTGFSVNRSDPRLKHVANVFSNYAVVAAIEPLNKGKFLFLGSENWLYSSFLSTISGENFVQNIFNWLEPTVDFSINSQISPRTRKLELSAYYSSQDPLATDISFPNGTILSSTSLAFNSTLGYYYQVIGLGDIRNHEIIITVRDGGLVLKEFNHVFLDVSTIPKILDLEINTITSPNPVIPSWSQDEESVSLVDKGLNITISHTESSFINTTIMITNQNEETLEVMIPPLNLFQNNFEEIKLNKTSDSKQVLEWYLPSNYSSGYYSYELNMWFLLNSSYSVLIENKKGKFFVPDPEPHLDSNTMIGGESLERYRSIETFADIPSWSPGERIELEIMVNDINSDEFIVYGQLIHYFLWLADRSVLQHFEIPSTETDKSVNFYSYLVPEEPIPIPDQDLAIEINNQVFLLLIFYRDKQGNFDIEPIFFRIGGQIFFDPTTFFIFTLFGLMAALGVLVFLVRRSSTRRVAQQYYIPRDYSRELTPPTIDKSKFCNNCGKKIPIQAFYCGWCGSHQDSE